MSVDGDDELAFGSRGEFAWLRKRELVAARSGKSNELIADGKEGLD
jgi:hypothetical protein